MELSFLLDADTDKSARAATGRHTEYPGAVDTAAVANDSNKPMTKFPKKFRTTSDGRVWPTPEKALFEQTKIDEKLWQRLRKTFKRKATHET